MAIARDACRRLPAILAAVVDAENADYSRLDRITDDIGAPAEAQHPFPDLDAGRGAMQAAADAGRDADRLEARPDGVAQPFRGGRVLCSKEGDDAGNIGQRPLSYLNCRGGGQGVVGSRSSASNHARTSSSV